MTQREHEPDDSGGAVERRVKPRRRRMDRLVDRYLLPIMAGIFAALLILAVVSVVVLHQQDQINANQNGIEKALANSQKALDRQAAAAKGGCGRLQKVRDDLNLVNWGIYSILEASGKKPDLTKLGALLDSVDPSTKALVVFLMQGQTSQNLVPLVLQNASYLPETDCEAAQNPGYVPPERVPFKLIARCFKPEKVDVDKPDTLRYIRPRVVPQCRA